MVNKDEASPPMSTSAGGDPVVAHKKKTLSKVMAESLLENSGISIKEQSSDPLKTTQMKATTGEVDQKVKEAHTDGSVSPYTKICGDLESLMDEFDRSIGTPPDALLQSIAEGKGTSMPSTKDLRRRSKRSSLVFTQDSSMSTHSLASQGNTPFRPPRRPSSVNFDDFHTEVPSKSLWIGNLDPTIGEDELFVNFSRFGPIESMRLLPIKECAFINYVNMQDAIRARNSMQGVVIGNMLIRIGYGKSDSALGNVGINFPFMTPPIGNLNSVIGPIPGLDLMAASRSVWVGNLNSDVTLEMLEASFAPFGPIESCRLLDIKNCAFINFFNVEDAANARMVMNGARIGTSVIKTGTAKPSSAQPTSRPESTIGIPFDNRRSSVGENFFFPPINNSRSNNIVIANSKTTATAGPAQSIVEGSESPFLSSMESLEYDAELLPLPPNLYLPPEFSGNAIKDLKRQVDYYSTSVEEIEALAQHLMPHMLAASIDPLGNMLVQRLLERGSAECRMEIFQALGDHLATVGIHKHGTWVVQKIINTASIGEEREFIVSKLRPYVVNLMKDQFGNYVIQCCLKFGPKLNQFVYDALYHCCLEIASSRFGSRAMKSCLEAPTVTEKQQKFVAMAIINQAPSLVQDCNRVIVLQWLLDSHLPDCYSHLVTMLKGNFADMSMSKHASAVVAKLIQGGSEDEGARQKILDELLSSAELIALLVEPISAAILLKALMTANPEHKYRMAKILHEQLSQLSIEQYSHLDKLSQEVEMTVNLIPETPSGLASPALGETSLIKHAVGGPAGRRTTIYRKSSFDIPQETSRKSSLLLGNLTTFLDPRPNDAEYDRSADQKQIAK